jgi:heme exporter protein D
MKNKQKDYFTFYFFGFYALFIILLVMVIVVNTQNKKKLIDELPKEEFQEEKVSPAKYVSSNILNMPDIMTYEYDKYYKDDIVKEIEVEDNLYVLYQAVEQDLKEDEIRLSKK